MKVGAKGRHNEGVAKLRLGDPINGTVGKSLGGRRYTVETRDAPKGWSVELHTKETLEPGTHTTFWVSRVVPVKSSLTVRAGDYGRLPVSEAMRGRYIKAFDAFLNDALDGDTLAELRGMATRIDTQDSADWLTVWRLLGEPEAGPLKELSQRLTELRDVRKTEPERAETVKESLLALWGDRFRAARRRLES